MNFSAVIPLYVTNPIAANGLAPRIHTQDRVSIPKCPLNKKYNNTATPQASNRVEDNS